MRKPATPDIRDELLVLRSREGDDQATAALAQRWQGRLWRHARLLTDNAEQAADAVQEAWLAIIRGLDRLQDVSRFGPWAYRIVTNKCADRVRHRVRDRRNEPLDERAHAAPDGASPGEPDPSADRLRELVRGLPKSQRALLTLVYVDGLSLREVSQALGIPVGTVKSRLFSVRQLLREKLKGEPS
jgi:RNA polymerase sigma factor (sigma-70 family)